MRLTLPFTEILELALRGAPLPRGVRDLTCTGATVRADLDLRAVPALPRAVRTLAAVTPIIRVDAAFRTFDSGLATFDLAVRAASVPVQRLLSHLTGLLDAELRSAHLADLVVVEQGPHGAPHVVVDLQAAVALRADGVALTGFTIADGAVRVEAVVRGFALRDGAPGDGS